MGARDVCESAVSRRDADISGFGDGICGDLSGMICFFYFLCPPETLHATSPRRRLRRVPMRSLKRRIFSIKSPKQRHKNRYSLFFYQ
jgi:hypothetical protein